ncbi:MAG: methionyl-tRNA formyltransferase [Nitrospirae bacterium]|nr:MAG: methionyl-tRNA formyltransferase [Nitrospirota bacterium]
MSIVFFGTPAFAIPSLKRLILHQEDIVLVVTQPDKSGGRGHRMIPPPVKVFSEERKIPVVQPNSIRDEDFLKKLKAISPEFIIVVAYGKIIPPEILELPEKGCINLHASLLPRYRGAAPIQWAIINGERETGITTMLMDEGLDTGPVLLQKKEPILMDDTTSTLSERLAEKGADLLVQTLKGIRRGEIKPKPQMGKPTYAPPLKKTDGLIDWNRTAIEIFNLIRGVQPWPGAYTYLRGKVLKIKKVDIEDGSGEPGKIVYKDKANLLVATREGLIRILELQLEGKKAMDIKSFLQGSGKDIRVGEHLGTLQDT